MFSEYLEKIENAGIYPVAALLIFFLLFIGLSIWALRLDRHYINNMKRLPLDKNIHKAGKNNGEAKKRK